MKKNHKHSNFFPAGKFKGAASGLALAFLTFWPATVWGQFDDPPPVHSFPVNQTATPDQNIADDEDFMDFFSQAAEGLDDPFSPPAVGNDPFQASPASPAQPSPAETRETASPASDSVYDLGVARPSSPPPVDSGGWPGSPSPPPSSPPLPPTVVEDFNRPPSTASEPLPGPAWENVLDSAVDPGTFISGAPLPELDAGQGQWIQLEIGQADSASRPAASVGAPLSVTVPTVTAPPLEEPSEPAVAAEAPPVRPREMESEERQRLRGLFADMMSGETESLPLAAGKVKAPEDSQAETKSPAGPGTQPESPATGLAAPAKASVAGDQVQEDLALNGQEPGGSSILKAGSLLSMENQYGAAAILPPLTEPLAKEPKKTAEPAVRKPVVEQPKQTAAKAPEVKVPAAVKPPAAQPPADKATDNAAVKAPVSAAPPAKAAKPRRAKGVRKAAASSVRANMIIINETGNAQVGENYGSVLRQLGHNVISVGQREPGGGTTGQTVINYRSGLKATAQAVAKQLPGRKVLVEAGKGQVLAGEIMIYVR